MFNWWNRCPQTSPVISVGVNQSWIFSRMGAAPFVGPWCHSWLKMSTILYFYLLSNIRLSFVFWPFAEFASSLDFNWIIPLAQVWWRRWRWWCHDTRAVNLALSSQPGIWNMSCCNVWPETVATQHLLKTYIVLMLSPTCNVDNIKCNNISMRDRERHVIPIQRAAEPCVSY